MVLCWDMKAGWLDFWSLELGYLVFDSKQLAGWLNHGVQINHSMYKK